MEEPYLVPTATEKSEIRQTIQCWYKQKLLTTIYTVRSLEIINKEVFIYV